MVNKSSYAEVAEELHNNMGEEGLLYGKKGGYVHVLKYSPLHPGSENSWWAVASLSNE